MACWGRAATVLDLAGSLAPAEAPHTINDAPGRPLKNFYCHLCRRRLPHGRRRRDLASHSTADWDPPYIPDRMRKWSSRSPHCYASIAPGCPLHGNTWDVMRSDACPPLARSEREICRPISGSPSMFTRMLPRHIYVVPIKKRLRILIRRRVNFAFTAQPTGRQ